MAETVALRLTVADHLNGPGGEFLDLGEIQHDAHPQRLWDFLAARPDTECCNAKETGHTVCWLVDQQVPGGLGDSREVTAERAADLLGLTPDALTGRLNEARAALGSVYTRIRGDEGHD